MRIRNDSCHRSCFPDTIAAFFRTRKSGWRLRFASLKIRAFPGDFPDHRGPSRSSFQNRRFCGGNSHARGGLRRCRAELRPLRDSVIVSACFCVLVSIVGAVIARGAVAPTISPIPDQITLEDEPILRVPFTIQDADTPALDPQTMLAKQPNRFRIRRAFLLINARGECIRRVVVQNGNGPLKDNLGLSRVRRAYTLTHDGHAAVAAEAGRLRRAARVVEARVAKPAT